MQLTRLKGFQDTMGAQARSLAAVEDCARKVVERHNVGEIRIPALERLELFQHSSGETSDVVEKQMYAFVDRDEAETTLALRPEGTPGVVRAYIEAGMDRSDPEQRFYYVGPMFRRERPQKGRFRQFSQFGVEIFGRADAATDAELMVMVDELRRELGLELNFEINSLGDAECRPRFRQAVLEYGRAHLAELCEDCRNRLERNPLRLLDCKIDVKLAEAAPKSEDFLCDNCRAHFATVRELLTDAGVPHAVNPRLVRGLDYYTRTTFEVVSTAVGAQSAVAAGGRYDGLVEALGGAAVAGTGFAIGVDRLALALDAARFDSRADAALAALGDAAIRRGMALAAEMRAAGLRVELLSPGRGLKALLRRADKIGARYAVIIGDNELARSGATLRDLKTSTQREVKQSDLVAEISAAALGGRAS
ncbi:MAG TPA: histidine--tRNA ligase [Candidatus Binataceae bacterium]|nr:histidine--tRNA ligase [Candidatus Binataceae bacterium]